MASDDAETTLHAIQYSHPMRATFPIAFQSSQLPRNKMISMMMLQINHSWVTSLAFKNPCLSSVVFLPSLELGMRRLGDGAPWQTPFMVNNPRTRETQILLIGAAIFGTSHY